jgi:4-hydroxy-3-polyprenylbenzoate decarboxylase
MSASVKHPLPWVVGITGASGAIYGTTLVKELLRAGRDVHLVVSEAGWRVLGDELGWSASRREQMLAEHFPSGGEGVGTLHYHPLRDVGASIASGSFRTAGMAIVPCSMGTLSGIARGASDNLLERAADVMLKERRKLIVVPRETPLNTIHLENMLALSRAGAVILPAMPAFYHKPESIDDLVRFLVGKILDLMDVDHQLFRRWGES